MTVVSFHIPVRTPLVLASLVSLVLALIALLMWRDAPAERATQQHLRGGSDTEHAADDGCTLLDHEHAAWTALLGRYVRDGEVDYEGLKRSGIPDLDAYVQSLQAVCRGNYDESTRGQKLAFWINAYNAYTLKLVLTHYPLSSIRNIGVLPGAAFRESFIPLSALHTGGDALLSLNEIEHDILRKQFQEPRIHFAIVCASESCPALRSEAYRARALEAQLTDAAQRFVRDPSKNRYDAATNTLHLSAIFDWFHDDFERAAKTVPAFVARYAEPTVAQAINTRAPRVQHLDYDWSLNGR